MVECLGQRPKVHPFAGTRWGSVESQPVVIGAGGIARASDGSVAASLPATHSTPSPKIDARTHTSPPSAGIRPMTRRIPHPARKARYLEVGILTTNRPIA